MALRAAANVIYEPIFAVMLHVQIVFGDVNLPSSCILADSRADSQNGCNLFMVFSPLGSRHLQITSKTVHFIFIALCFPHPYCH